jgi:xylulokinase
VGRLKEQVATELGLPANIPIHHGPGDAGATTLGTGAGVIGPVYAYLGTSGWVAFSASERADPEQGAITLAHPHPERYIQVAPLLTAGGNLAWLRNLFGDGEYGKLIAEALERPPARLLYLPYLNGERSPFRDPNARGTFVGLENSTQKADLYRAVLEGVVYAYRHALEALTIAPFTQLTLTGGGARSAGWCQLFADLLGTTVTVLDDAENVGVRGAVLAAQVARGELSDYSLSVEYSQIFHPDKAQSGWFERQYAIFRELYPALRTTFARLGANGGATPE